MKNHTNKLVEKYKVVGIELADAFMDNVHVVFNFPAFFSKHKTAACLATMLVRKQIIKRTGQYKYEVLDNKYFENLLLNPEICLDLVTEYGIEYEKLVKERIEKSQALHDKRSEPSIELEPVQLPDNSSTTALQLVIGKLADRAENEAVALINHIQTVVFSAFDEIEASKTVDINGITVSMAELFHPNSPLRKLAIDANINKRLRVLTDRLLETIK